MASARLKAPPSAGYTNCLPLSGPKLVKSLLSLRLSLTMLMSASRPRAHPTGAYRAPPFNGLHSVRAVEPTDRIAEPETPGRDIALDSAAFSARTFVTRPGKALPWRTLNVLPFHLGIPPGYVGEIERTIASMEAHLGLPSMLPRQPRA